ncbi:hypothetical protein CIRG_08532 [Coccidioides immitis RMSCC 2394]|uniref:Uncharacterized protein n=1 Tax=Coccidioides immitis RMSCC 2394 TaxID=404692 RepID=A0A0J6YJL0_COCIT|nr:hypothetical protein CIRG_08532 [Coccidioides immitis RMSCC 2394]
MSGSEAVIRSAEGTDTRLYVIMAYYGRQSNRVLATAIGCTHPEQENCYPIKPVRTSGSWFGPEKPPKLPPSTPSDLPPSNGSSATHGGLGPPGICITVLYPVDVLTAEQMGATPYIRAADEEIYQCGSNRNKFPRRALINASHRRSHPDGGR